jgi:hypothetical protein
MDKTLEDKIRARAQEIYEYHRDTGLHLVFDRGRLRERTAKDDWLEAELEVKHNENIK